LREKRSRCGCERGAVADSPGPARRRHARSARVNGRSRSRIALGTRNRSPGVSTGKPSQDPQRGRATNSAPSFCSVLALACGPVHAADDLKGDVSGLHPWWCVSWALLFRICRALLVTCHGRCAVSACRRKRRSRTPKRALFPWGTFPVRRRAGGSRWVVLSVGEAGLWSATTVIGPRRRASLLVRWPLSRYQGSTSSVMWRSCRWPGTSTRCSSCR